MRLAGKATQFQKPADDVVQGPAWKEERSDAFADSTSSFVYNPWRHYSLDQQRQRLPIFKYRNSLLYLLEKHQTVVVVGETGSGKTTQIPQYLLESGWCKSPGKKIGITQPRRVAAITISQRVAEERGAPLGREVGYVVRFDDCSSAETKIKFVTDGILVREMMADPLLNQYSVLMLDEAHERSISTDIAMGLLKKIMKKRKDLKVIISSATLDAESLRDYFELGSATESPSSTILTVEGRIFPVDIFYLSDPIASYLTATIDTVLKIHRTQPLGDILVFLTGQEEVDHVCQLLSDHGSSLERETGNRLIAQPLYGALLPGEQLKAFELPPAKTRKVVVATNIAETSVTINGIVYVVDAGFVKIRAFNPQSGVDSLIIVPTSAASAEQRAGRAGRNRPGKAFRLYTEDGFKTLIPASVPEIQRTSLAPVILQLKALGVDNVLRFNFPAAPSSDNMIQGIELLYGLGALDDTGALTEPYGIQMAELPLSPMLAKMVIGADEFHCREEALTIAAMLQVENVFVKPARGDQKVNAERCRRKFSALEGDHITLLNVYTGFLKFGKSSQWCRQNFLHYKGMCRAVEIRKQLLNHLLRLKVSSNRSMEQMAGALYDVDNIRRCIVAGFFANAAYLHPSGTYRTVRDDHELHIHPGSVLYAEKPPAWIIFNEILQTNLEFMRDITAIEPQWLYELAPHYYQFGTDRQMAAKRALEE